MINFTEFESIKQGDKIILTGGVCQAKWSADSRQYGDGYVVKYNYIDIMKADKNLTISGTENGKGVFIPFVTPNCTHFGPVIIQTPTIVVSDQFGGCYFGLFKKTTMLGKTVFVVGHIYQGAEKKMIDDCRKNPGDLTFVRAWKRRMGDKEEMANWWGLLYLGPGGLKENTFATWIQLDYSLNIKRVSYSSEIIEG